MNNYHQETIYQRNAMLGHALDWSNQPLTFKTYKKRAPVPLPLATVCNAGFFDLSLHWPPRPKKAIVPQADQVSAVVRLGAGITSPRWEDDLLLGLRAYASAGALYPCELYVIVSDVQDMDDGLYHFTPLGPAWHLLWKEKLDHVAAKALGSRPSRLTFFITSLFWRSLWKYNTRGYRYCLLDGGHMLANLELALAGFSLLPKTTINFADNSVSALLGLANLDEAPLVAVQAGGAPSQIGAPDIDLPPLDLQYEPLSRRIGRDNTVLQAHMSANLLKPAPEPLWFGPKLEAGQEIIPLPPAREYAGQSVEQVIHKRRSQREFSQRGLTAAKLGLLLQTTLPANSPVMASVVLGAGNEIAAGTYLYLPDRHALLARNIGQDWRRIVADASLGQSFMAKAQALVVLWADLDMLEEQASIRSYRHAMLAAGRAGQRCYLASTALNLHCCGVGAFYDDDLAAINGMPQRAAPLYVLACG